MNATEIKRQQLLAWISRCKENIENFKMEYEDMDFQDKVEFTRRQYYLLYLLNNFMIGKSKLEGVDTKKIITQQKKGKTES